jgi:hypothetical protein
MQNRKKSRLLLFGILPDTASSMQIFSLDGQGDTCLHDVGREVLLVWPSSLNWAIFRLRRFRVL